jgi:hypothetical protein
LREVVVGEKGKEQAETAHRLDEREAAQRRAEQARDAERHALLQHSIELDQGATAMARDLTRRTGALADAETEIKQAFVALGSLVEQLEQEEFTVQDGRGSFANVPTFVRQTSATLPAERTSV